MKLHQLYIEYLQKIPNALLLVLAAICVISGDYCAKAWSVNQKPMFLVLAFLGYFMSGFFYIPTLLRQGLVITSLIWSLLSIIGFLVIGLVIFKEQLSVVHSIGVFFGVIALLLLSVF